MSQSPATNDKVVTVSYDPDTNVWTFDPPQQPMPKKKNSTVKLKRASPSAGNKQDWSFENVFFFPVQGSDTLQPGNPDADGGGLEIADGGADGSFPYQVLIKLKGSGKRVLSPPVAPTGGLVDGTIPPVIVNSEIGLPDGTPPSHSRDFGTPPVIVNSEARSRDFSLGTPPVIVNSEARTRE